MKRYKNYPRDPFWIQAKFDSTCKCGTSIFKGNDILYFPNSRSVECSDCSAQTWALLEDEKTNDTMLVF
jgi:hypothetical protein